MKWYIVENEFDLWEVYDWQFKLLDSLTYDELLDSFYSDIWMVELDIDTEIKLPYGLMCRLLAGRSLFAIEEGEIV